MFYSSFYLYRVKGFNLTEEQLAERLAAHKYEPCRPYEEGKIGWISPFGEHSDYLNPGAMRCQMLCLKVEVRKVPANTINTILKERVAELRRKDPEIKISGGHKKQLKEDIKNELLPRAFPRYDEIYAYIDSELNYLVINTSSKSKAEAFVSALAFALDAAEIKFSKVKTTREPAAVMTQWLISGDTPNKISTQISATLKDTESASGNIKYNKQDLNDEKLKGYLQEKKTVSELSVSYSDKITFTLNSDFIIKSVKWSDLVLSENSDENNDSLESTISSDFLIMRGYAKTLFEYLVDDCLGGEQILENL